MILAIDIGNTNVVIGCIHNGEIRFTARMATDALKTADQYTAELKSILDLFQLPEKPDGSIISSVVPPVLSAFKAALKRLIGKEPLVVGPGVKTGLNIQIENPAQTGGDIVVAAVAALREYPLPLAIIDMGTATTISVLNEKGAFIGGCICPGVRSAMEALTSKAALLPGVSLDIPAHVIGKNTIECMQSGSMYGAAAMLDGMLERMENELGSSFSVVTTGGLASSVIPLCKHQMRYDENLLLKGLWAVYCLNEKSGE